MTPLGTTSIPEGAADITGVAGAAGVADVSGGARFVDTAGVADIAGVAGAVDVAGVATRPNSPPVRVASLRLGFGCSVLMASLGRRQSLRLLTAAYDSGIRHFDVARSYGYGEAESVLGLFAKQRRSEISITTKLGIAPPPRYLSAAPVKRMARSIVRGIPALRPLLRSTASRMTRTSRFDITSARQSFECSLRKLGTAYVDVLLLHDCTAEEALEPPLREFLEDCVQRGTVLRYGVASDRSTALAVAARDAGTLQVAQFADDREQCQPILKQLPDTTFPITHSVVARDLQRINEWLSSDGSLVRSWSETIGVNVRDREHLATLILATALRRNSGGCVLYASRNEARLQATVSAIADGLISDLQCSRFEALLMKRSTAATDWAGAA